MWPSGQLVNLANLYLRDINIHDIAHHLSMLCRYTGGVKTFYSVAEHSVLVKSLLAERGYSERIQLAGLLHDAAEAYIGDVSSPLKSMLSDYQRVEHDIDSLMNFKFNLQMDVPAVKRWVKSADQAAYRIESAVLRDMDKFDGQGRGLGMQPHDARGLFLDNYERLEAAIRNQGIA